MRRASLVFLCGLLAAPGLAIAGGLRRPAASAELPAPERARVTGRVIDGDGKAVGGVTVVASATRAKGPLRRAQSDRDGQFHFALPPGEYVFLALDRALAGATPAMTVARALDVVLLVSAPTLDG